MTTRFYDEVGYVDTVDKGHGVYEEQVIYKAPYYGDIVNASIRYRGAEKLHDDVITTDKISILSDAYAVENFSRIRFVKYLGTYWKVTEVSVKPPRIILTLGGVYNGPTNSTSRGAC